MKLYMQGLRNSGHLHELEIACGLIIDLCIDTRFNDSQSKAVVPLIEDDLIDYNKIEGEGQAFLLTIANMLEGGKLIFSEGSIERNNIQNVQKIIRLILKDLIDQNK